MGTPVSRENAPFPPAHSAMVLSAPLIWLVLAGVLLVLVLAGVDTDGLLLIAGIAGLLLTLTAALLTLPAAAQVLLFVALVGAGYLGLRSWSARQGSRTIPPSARAELAEVIAPFDAHGEGRVRWQGQSWAALNLDPSSALASGAQVTVMGREGTRLQVLPRRPADLSLADLPPVG
jgi:membrane protein implicated in regulation of membrane protease activity